MSNIYFFVSKPSASEEKICWQNEEARELLIPKNLPALPKKLIHSKNVWMQAERNWSLTD